MTDEVKLAVQILRYCEESGARCGNCPSGSDEKGVPVCHSQSHIADLLESLSAELEQVKNERDGLNVLLAQAQSMLETRTRERDAAVKDIPRACGYCKYYLGDKSFVNCNHECMNISGTNTGWQWRGVQEET